MLNIRTPKISDWNKLKALAFFCIYVANTVVVRNPINSDQLAAQTHIA